MNELSEQYANSDQTAHEQEPTDLECGISVKGLTKIYKVSVQHSEGYIITLHSLLCSSDGMDYHVCMVTHCNRLLLGRRLLWTICI